MNKMKIVTPLLTIFNDDGSIDFDGNKRLINHLFDNGVDGIVILGSTGEFTAIDFDDKKEIIKQSIDCANKRGIVFVGTACPNVNDTVELSNYAIENGADGVLIICQYYFGMSDEEIFHYYDYLAPRINGNIYLYNFPARTNTSFSSDIVLKLLRKHKNIVGMKESVASFAHTRNIMREVKKEFKDFEMYSGFDDQFLDNADYGGVGSIGALSNLFPELWAKWIKAKNENDTNTVIEIKSKIMDLMHLYEIESNCFGLFKHILKNRGLDINTTTLFPFEKVDEKSIDEAMKLIYDVLEAK